MSEFIFEYYIFVLLAALGAIQLGAVAGRLKGLLVLKHRTAAVGLGLVFIAAAPVWFFSTGERNINDFEGGITANGQALYAFLGSITALASTLAVTSLINFRLGRGALPPFDGLHSLREASYLIALSGNLRYWSRAWRKLTSNYFFG